MSLPGAGRLWPSRSEPAAGRSCSSSKNSSLAADRSTVTADKERALTRRRTLHVLVHDQPSTSSCSLLPELAGRIADRIVSESLPLDRRSLLLATALGATVAGALPLPRPAAAAEAAAIDTVLVVGSTGQTGRRVVQQLRAAGYKVRAGVRDRLKAASLGLALDPGVELVDADVVEGDAASLAAAVGGAQAVVCATGFADFKGLNAGGFGDVDERGTEKLIDAAKLAGATRFVLVSSLLTNARAVGQADNPNYKFLNLFGGVLDHKLAAERYLRASSLTWTIIRPGGLSNEPPEAVGRLVVGKEDSLFGLPGDPGREISRDTVAALAVAALAQPAAADKVVEAVASADAPELPPERWFP